MNRIYHHYEKWECWRAGFYDTTPPRGMSADEACAAYRDFLSDIPRFVAAMDSVLEQWPHSCDQFLSNSSINRIAWMGQAAMCNATGVPSIFRGGFALLSPSQQAAANAAASQMIDRWERMKASQYESGESIHIGMEGERLC
jgi:hypothetical protein